MTKDPRDDYSIRYGSLEESIEATRKLLTEQIENFESKGDRIAVTDLLLYRGISPVWATWLKQDCHSSVEALSGVTYLAASLMTEVIVNICKTKEDYQPVASNLIENLIAMLQWNLNHLDTAVKTVGFRKKDS